MPARVSCCPKELFIKRLAQAGQREASVHRKTMVGYNDMGTSRLALSKHILIFLSHDRAAISRIHVSSRYVTRLALQGFSHVVLQTLFPCPLPSPTR